MYCIHYCDVIMGAVASQITSPTIVYSTVYSDADQRKHKSSASLAFVRGIHQWPVNSPHKGRTSIAENVSIWWRHHVSCLSIGLSVLSRYSMGCLTVSPAPVWVRTSGPTIGKWYRYEYRGRWHSVGKKSSTYVTTQVLKIAMKSPLFSCTGALEIDKEHPLG